MSDYNDPGRLAPALIAAIVCAALGGALILYAWLAQELGWPI